MQISANIQVNAPVEKVFDVFSDVTKIQDRIEGISLVEVLSDVQSGVGTRWRETRTMFGKEATEEMEISVFEENQSYEVVAESHGMKYHSKYTFTEKDGGTYVEMVFSGTPVSFGAKVMGFMFVFMKGQTQKALEQDMIDLKKVCEEDGSSDEQSE